MPRIHEIEGEIREIGLQISKCMLSGNPDQKKKVRALREKTERLNSEKAYLLTDHNFQTNYMDIWYTCALCKDTGLLDTGERCPCFSDRLR